MTSTLARVRRVAGRGFFARLRGSRYGKAWEQARTRGLHRYAPVRDQVLYESFFGTGTGDSPRAIFDALLDDPDFSHLRHVWVLADQRAAAEFVRRYRHHPRVTFVRRGGSAYALELARSRWLVNDSTFPPFFVKRPGQTYVNTWHGTPLKRMSFDMPNGAFEVGNTVRNFLLADYLVSANAHMTDVMYRQAYRLDGIYGGAILEVGYPRVDASLALAEDAGRARSVLAEHGVEVPPGRRVVLYAPTWKGESYNAPADDAADIAAFVNDLQTRLGDDWWVLARPHQRVARHSRGVAGLEGRIVPATMPANEALACADGLVTDYSSIFFDYLALDRPLVFYVPDAGEYDDLRGRYLSDDELPGPQCTDVGAVAEALRSPAPDWAARRETARARFAPWEDGGATQRVIGAVLRGEEPSLGRVVRCENASPRILIYLGGLLRNGITSSVLNLLGELDYDRFDVSVNYGTPRVEEARETIRAVDSRARLLETPAGHAERFVTNPWRRARGLVLPSRRFTSKEQVRRAFGDEYRRRYGDTSFDYLVDFSGYSARPAAVHLASPPALHSVWFHNDLAADRQRVVNGAQPNLRSLGQVRELYPLHDKLVSVSPALNEVNRRSFADDAPADRFVAARNLIAGERIVEAAARDDARDTELAQEGLSQRARSDRETAFALDGDAPVFASVGRLSPEKNHARLLEAFAIVARTDERSRLLVVGDGPLRGELEALGERLGIDERILWIGGTANPWAYMSRATCLVMSSDYEGQPMVILEARVLGLPVVSTRFDSVESALPPGAGTVVEREPEALAAGMRAHVDGAVPAAKLDHVAYNRECMGEFYRAIGAE